MIHKPRVTAPAASDRNWLAWDKGGHNYCIKVSGNSVLPNCTGYAWGRWRELLGKFHELSRGDAEVWWGKGDGYNRGQTPKLGAIACWKQGTAGNKNDGLGHVAVVEEIHTDGTITTSNSAYKSTNFYLQTLKSPFVYKPGFVLQGFIYLPVDLVPAPKPIPKPVPVEKVWNRVAENGIFIAVKENVRRRLEPSTTAKYNNVTKVGVAFKYDSYIDNEGIRWVSGLQEGQRYYCARRELDGAKREFGTAELVVTATPTPAPQPVVKKDYVELLKDHRRYATYDVGIPPVAANIVERNYLTTPGKFEIVGWTNPKVAIILVNGTRRQIYIDSTRAKLIKE